MFLLSYINSKLDCIVLVFLIIINFSCSNDSKNLSEKLQKDENVIPLVNEQEANIIKQQKPVIMILPSDALLKRLSCLKEIDQEGKTVFIRDYRKVFANELNLRFLVSSIEKEFSKSGYPLDNLEQQLKQIDNDKATDEIDNIANDLKSVLLTTAKPDFIIDIDYDIQANTTSRSYKTNFIYNITVFDAYTNKSIASIQNAITQQGEQLEIGTLNIMIENELPQLQNQIKKHFQDIISNGVEITVRITVANESSFSLSDYCQNKEYGDIIREWLKKNTINSTFKPVKSTDKQLRFTNVRIYTHTQDGLQYSAYDFANDLRKMLNQQCEIKAKNLTQSIGDAHITIK